VSRWEPNARGRLEQAALELYRERGFDDTTVAEIAARAGLTERTFFRHFADKREVLFSGAGALQDLLVSKVDDAPESLSPIEAIVAALVEAADGMFEERRPFARGRQAVIAANRELEERELVKFAALSAALAGALRRRGVTGPAASLAADAGIAVFRVAFDRWTEDTGEDTLAYFIRASLGDLQAVATQRGSAPVTGRR